MVLESCREAFIPYRCTDVITLCLEDGQLDTESAEQFRSFCKILSAFYHFQFHDDLEEIGDNYTVFNPDSEVRSLSEPSLQEQEQMEDRVIRVFKNILDRANYIPMPQEAIHRSLADRSLIALKTKVDFDDFDQLLCYYRGDVTKTVTEKKFFFWRSQRTVSTLERLVLLIKFKETEYFHTKAATQRKPKRLKFVPGKMYVYFYKNIPKLDLDLLFPNIETTMTWRDRLLLVVPAIGAAIPVILKTVPNLLLLIAAILLALNARSALQSIQVEEEQARDLMPVLIATLTLAIALGGFAFQQYNKYKSKKIKFQKDITDTLFFKNLASNASVFQMLVALAEEEECKETILVYYHLLTSPEPLTPKALDAKIETWMSQKTGAQINFDIHGPLDNLQNIRGYVASANREKALMDYDQQGRCCVLSLQEARAVLDYFWDNAF